jgi:hypothetical protein
MALVFAVAIFMIRSRRDEGEIALDVAAAPLDVRTNAR